MFWRELKRQLPVDVVVDIEEFTERVREMCPDAKVYLYGSFAKGTWLRDSDVDLVVVSKCFENTEFSARYPVLRKFASDKRSFEILAYTPEELRKALEKSIVVKDASTYWIEVTQ
jgi:predicted nucleotidyltransferase